MNSVKLNKIKHDRYDIDNYLISQIKKEKFITNQTYNQFIDYSNLPNSLIIKRNVQIFYDQTKKLHIKYPKLSLPWNLAYPSMGTRYNLVVIPNKPYVFKLELSKLANWIESALKFKFLNKLICRTQSSRGQHSPFTRIDLWELSNFGSPGFVNYKLQLLYYRVNYYLNLMIPSLSMSYAKFGLCLSLIIHNRPINLHNISINKYAIKFAVYFVRNNLLNNYDLSLLKYYLNSIQYDILFKVFYSYGNYYLLGYRNSVNFLITMIRIKNNDPELLLTYM